VETALFMFGAGALTSPLEAVLGVGLGLLVAGIIGVGIVRVSWRLNLRRFFQVTGVFLVIVAAGLFSNAVLELREALGWQLLPVYNLTAIFPANETNTAGYLLRGIIGYSDAPTLVEVAAYFGYWIVVILAYLGIRTGKITIVTAPVGGPGTRCSAGGCPRAPRPNRRARIVLESAGFRRVEALRGNLDHFRRAGRLAGHAVDAVRFPDHVGLVAPVRLPLTAPFLDDLVVARPLLARGQEPLEHVDGADIHTDPVRYAAIEVDRDVGAVDAESRGIGVPIRVQPLLALREDLVAKVLARLRIFVRLVHEVRVDRLGCKVHFSRHSVASKEL